MKRISALFVAIIICISLTACVSDSEYNELEERVSNLENMLGVQQSETDEQENIEPTTETTQEDSSATAEEQKSASFVYYIDGLSDQQICDEVMYYLNNVPYQNQSYDEYSGTLKVTPVSDKHDEYGQSYNFYGEDTYEMPDKDSIYSINIEGTYPEMDGTIGIGDKGWGGGGLGISVTFYITDYDKAVSIYDLLYDQISPHYTNVSNSKEGTNWRGDGTIRMSEHSSMSESFISMSKRQDGCFGITAKITRRFQDVQ